MADPRAFLSRAESHLRRAHDAAPHPTDWYDLTIYGFYCLEAAVMAAATHVGLQVPRTHPGKAAASEKLARDHGLPDVSVLLPMLNAARKAAAYGDTTLPPLDPARLVRELERYVAAVGQMIAR
jgi:hypothetical protein